MNPGVGRDLSMVQDGDGAEGLSRGQGNDGTVAPEVCAGAGPSPGVGQGRAWVTSQRKDGVSV